MDTEKQTGERCVSRTKNEALGWGLPVGALVLLLLLLPGKQTRAVGNLTITTPRAFSSLDGSLDDADGVADGVLTVSGKLTISRGGSIVCNDPSSPPSADACPMKFAVSGDMEIEAGGSISADNNTGGGSGGDIDIGVGGNLMLRGPSGADSGALLSSRRTSGAGAAGAGGNITIVVGGVTVVDDVPQCGRPQGDIFMEAGSTVTADALGNAGNIKMFAGHDITIDGTVSSLGTTASGRGGQIVLDACCNLLINNDALVSSRGVDPGADLVHLQACTVEVLGKAESTARGHQTATSPANLCNAPARPGKPSGSTACVEIWSGTTIVIDATGDHRGEVNADVGQSAGGGSSRIRARP